MPLRSISFDPRTYKHKLFSCDLTHISMPIKPPPPCFHFKYSHSMSLFGRWAPYIVKVFLVIPSIFFNSSKFRLIIPAPYLNTATAQVLIARILYLPFNLDLNINLNLLLHSDLTLIFISCSLSCPILECQGKYIHSHLLLALFLS